MLWAAQRFPCREICPIRDMPLHGAVTKQSYHTMRGKPSQDYYG
jgi:hypothetical protein